MTQSLSYDPAPLLRLARKLPAEAAHRLTVRLLATDAGPRARGAEDPILAQRLWGLDFPNPVGLAAGFDKHGECHAGALRLGFGFVEVGTVTPRPQPGNPRPRVFRLPEDAAIVNRAGFNSEGLAAVAARLARRDRSAGLVGGNVGKNKDTADAAEDYVAGIAALAPLVDYLVVNVSSPNTPGLRDLQHGAVLAGLIARCRAARDAAIRSRVPPLLLKIAPDLDEAEVAATVGIALEGGVDGLIATNTTLARPASLRGQHRREAGGLSGAPLREPALQVLRWASQHAGGRLPIVAVGGIDSGAEAYRRIRAGASLVQLYTALVYAGPGLVARIKADLAAALRRDGFASLTESVGVDRDRTRADAGNVG